MAEVAQKHKLAHFSKNVNIATSANKLQKMWSHYCNNICYPNTEP